MAEVKSLSAHKRPNQRGNGNRACNEYEAAIARRFHEAKLQSVKSHGYGQGISLCNVHIFYLFIVFLYYCIIFIHYFVLIDSGC